MVELSSSRFGRTLVVLVCVLLVSAAWGAPEDIRATLFKAADDARESAQAASADILAPRGYSEGQRYYERAVSKLERGKSVESIRADLDKAVEYFKAATKATELSSLTLTDAIKARGDAVLAEAAKYAESPWNRAEETFKRAATTLEDGDVNVARSDGEEARKLFREAELTAIKTNYLGGAKDLLAKAKKERAHKYAPKTYARAESLLAKAEKELTQSRYDTDVPRTLAKEAKNTTAHAIYIASVVKESKSKDLSIEDLLLEWETPVTQIGERLGMAVTMDKGFQPPTDAILGQISELQRTAEEAKQLGLQVKLLEEELGGKSQLVQAQERRREQLAKLSRMFNENEAQILREGNDIILRMIGLSFAVGKSDIDSKYFGLLKRVQDAILVFPGSKVTVEGHTDSFGADDFNLRLSKDRAESVRNYLIANLGMPSTSVNAVGYGETRPIANNETAEGRARNRRIDIVIRPKK
jgi:outer membrane protein OmpA-like peptidoglycan-associated protein